MNLLLLATLAFALSALLTWWVARPSSALRVIDQPGERSLHQRPTPRLGGIAVLATIGLLGAFILAQPIPINTWQVVAGLVLVAAISLLDDVRSIPAAPRLLVHLLVSLVLVSADWVRLDLFLPLELPRTVQIAVAALAVVWMINLYNFMDGMDGLAGGMTVLGFTFLGWLAWPSQSSLYSAFCVLVVAASAGFLVFNFPPARLFLGDIGSAPLGYLSATAILGGATLGVFPITLGLLVFSPFIVDATVTLFRRGLRGEPVWQAHRTHYYQRLVLSGWSHRRTVLWEYLLMVLVGFSAVAAARAGGRAPLVAVAVWAVVYAGLISFLERRLRTERR